MLMNLLPCNMHIDRKMGQFGVDFSSCEDFQSCYGGCSIFWKNCSFEALKELKEHVGREHEGE